MKYLYCVFIVAMLVSCCKSHENIEQLKDGECYYTINGIKHWVKIKGSDNHTTPVVIVHGGPGGNNYSFERTIGPKLEEFATIVYYEQRGCGRSEAPKDPNDYLIPTLLSDLEVLRDSLGIQKMILLGYSFGAELSLWYALNHPNRVEKLILSSPAELSTSNMLVQIQGFYSIGDSIIKSGIERILKDTITIEKKFFKVWNSCPVDIVDKFLFVKSENAKKNRQLWDESNLTNTGLMAKVYFENKRSDLIEKVSGLKIPTLMICGIYDKNGGLHTGFLLKQVLPINTVKLYENSAHFPDMEEPVRFAGDVKKFIIE